MDENNIQETVTHIARGTSVKADIKTNADIHVSGTINGDIETNKKLVISETGKVTGTARTKNAIIAGKFTGELRVMDQIDLSKTAVVDGFIFSKILKVDEDATLIGILNIGKDVDVMNAKIKQTKKNASQRPEKDPDKNKKAAASEKNKKEESKEFEKSTEHRYLKDVYIGIPDKVSEEDKESIRMASEKFMNSLGFTLEIFDESNENTFFQKLSFTRLSPEDHNDIEQRFRKAKERIESALLNKGSNTNGDEQQNAANTLTQILKKFKEFVFIFGPVLLIQHIDEDVQTIAVEFVPDELKDKLKKSPEIVTKPSGIQTYLDL